MHYNTFSWEWCLRWFCTISLVDDTPVILSPVRGLGISLLFHGQVVYLNLKEGNDRLNFNANEFET